MRGLIPSKENKNTNIIYNKRKSTMNRSHNSATKHTNHNRDNPIKPKQQATYQKIAKAKVFNKTSEVFPQNKSAPGSGPGIRGFPILLFYEIHVFIPSHLTKQLYPRLHCCSQWVVHDTTIQSISFCPILCDRIVWRLNFCEPLVWTPNIVWTHARNFPRAIRGFNPPPGGLQVYK